MRTTILLILYLCCCLGVGYAQDDNDYSLRIKEGRLTYEECSNLLQDDNRLKDAVPSLLNLKGQLATDSVFSAAQYYDVIGTLCDYYNGISDYASTRDLLNEAMELFHKRVPEPNNEFTRLLLCYRGKLGVTLKNYGNAQYDLGLALKFFEEKNDYGDPYLVALLNMAMTYQAVGDVLSAKIYMDEAVDTYESLHGSIFDITDDNNLLILSNYGYVCEAVGHHQEAEKCLLSVISKCKRSYVFNDIYTLAVNNLSTIYMKQGRWEDGAKLLENIVSENSDYNYMFAQNRTICYLNTHDILKAVAALEEMNSYSTDNISRLFSHFSGLERENYWTSVSKELTFINNLIAYHTQDSHALELAYDNALFCKNALVKSSRLLGQFTAESTNPDIRQLYSKYKALKAQLAYKSKGHLNGDSLRYDIVDAERSILNNAGDFGLWLRDDAKTWKDVKASLDDDEIAIEFCYAPRMEHYPDVEPYYGAFVLRKDFVCPKLISLENVDTVEALLDAENTDAVFINNLYASDMSVSLHKMLWGKITPYLKSIKKIYYSPTGYLSNIKFDILRDEDGLMMNEKHAMIRVSSTANIAKMKTNEMSRPRSSVLYGNIKYDAASSEMAAASSPYEAFSGTDVDTELAFRSENERGRWEAIPSTKDEIDGIGKLLTQIGVQVKKFEGNAANEESFKQLDGHSPDILHLATHGFLIDTKRLADGNKFFATTNVYSQKEAYMMWTGLILAGGNNKWQGNFNLTDVEDGILTADEISQLDLSRTKLVVLSACETARGKIDPVDGVFGLQRAFKMAGVGTIVMSLWKVQDDATSMLMRRFYMYLTECSDRHQALWKAMKDVRDKYNDPYYWAGFVMLD